MMSFDNTHSPDKHLLAHLRTAVDLLDVYDGGLPFSHFIKAYFSQHKKYGSRDRRRISMLCYCSFRLGAAYPGLGGAARILKGLQLSQPAQLAEWSAIMDSYELPTAAPARIFPWKKALSAAIDPIAFEASHLHQPDLFLRIRPGFEEQVTGALDQAGLDYDQEGATVRLPNASALPDNLELNRQVVIQDLSSQQTAGVLKQLAAFSVGKPRVWDCCAASGGKALMVSDLLGPMELTVSDIRPSIMANLRKRFGQAGIVSYSARTGDATKMHFKRGFDLIIADVPCTGSGTWSRTPEQLCYFDPVAIERYASMQQSILNHIIRYLNPGGYLLYITCSVFQQENEAQTGFLQERGLVLRQQMLLDGYRKKADTLFSALLQQPS
ncbi:RsmB/NOP family class I SAM-dependent RNA methyltransferase [Niabella terrae]